MSNFPQPNEKNSGFSQITEKTWVPISLVIALAGCVFWVGYSFNDLNATKQRVVSIEGKIDALGNRLSILENRQGVNELQFSQIDTKFKEIKESLADIKEALRIKP